MFVQSSKLGGDKRKVKTEALLSVANPRFDREQFPQLSDLPAAAREALEIKRYYEQSQIPVLIGEDATKELVKSEMGHSDVVHLALHSNDNEVSPLLSKMMLAR